MADNKNIIIDNIKLFNKNTNEIIEIPRQASNWKEETLIALNIDLKPTEKLEDVLSGYLYDVNNDINNNNFFLPFISDQESENGLLMNDDEAKKFWEKTEKREATETPYQLKKQRKIKKEKNGNKQLEENKNDKKKEEKETEIKVNFKHFLDHIFNNVQREVSRSLEIGSDVVVSIGDIECYKDGNVILSVEAKDVSNNNMHYFKPQLVAALLAQAFFKLRRNKVYNGNIQVLGVSLWGCRVNFFNAEFKKDYLERLQNHETPEEKMATVLHYPKKYKTGLSLNNANDLKIIITTLYRFNNATRKDCISEYFITNKIQFEFLNNNDLTKYFKIIEAIVRKPNNGMLAGGYFVGDNKNTPLDLYIFAEQLHVEKGIFKAKTYLKRLSKNCKKIIQENDIIHNTSPSYFAELKDYLYFDLKNPDNLIYKVKVPNAIKISVKFTQHSNIKDLLCSFDFKPAQIGFSYNKCEKTHIYIMDWYRKCGPLYEGNKHPLKVQYEKKGITSELFGKYQNKKLTEVLRKDQQDSRSSTSPAKRQRTN